MPGSGRRYGFRAVPVDDPHLLATRRFFTPRAATWDDRFPGDGPAFTAAVAALGPAAGATVVDVGCGTGRALPVLRAAVGSGGRVLGVDVTPAMAEVAARRGPVVVADARRLPLADGTADAVLAAGLVTHLPEPLDGLVELARITRSGGRLGLFHPIGRAALAARHGHPLDPADLRDPANLPAVLAGAGWSLDLLDDAPHRYLALATRH
jgi:SAM-dependent methyltransferase